MNIKGIYTPCSPCSNTGIEIIDTRVGEQIERQEIVCRTCLGEKYVLIMYLSDEFISLMEGIATEQASQRVDLTAVLTQIWNKVNSL